MAKPRVRIRKEIALQVIANYKLSGNPPYFINNEWWRGFDSYRCSLGWDRADGRYMVAPFRFEPGYVCGVKDGNKYMEYPCFMIVNKEFTVYKVSNRDCKGVI